MNNLLIDDIHLSLKNRIGEIDFNTNFRNSILFELLMQDRNVRKDSNEYFVY